MTLLGRLRRASTHRDKNERGAALLIAVTSIAILTALAVDLAYETRVSLQMAANARDELRATYLAKSALSMSRLVLYFQGQLDQASSALPAGLSSLFSLGAQTTQSTQGSQSGSGQTTSSSGGGQLSLRLWDLIPIDSSVVSLFLGSGPGQVRTSAPTLAAGTQRGAAQEGTRRVFGDTQGSFYGTIEDEDRKVNLRQFDAVGSFPATQALRLAQLVTDPKYDFLFDEEDANGMKVSRKELFAAIKDFEDIDQTLSIFTGDAVTPFEAGYGDENGLYARLPDRYQAKNAPFDSLDELFMVSGVSDAFMAAFGDKLTVYPDVNATINVNTSDPLQLSVNALVMSDPPGVPQPAMLDPNFLAKLQEAIAVVKPLPFLSISSQQFANMLQALGVKVQAVYLQSSTDPGKNPFGASSSTFHIHAVGVAGDVKKSIDAVVTFDRRAEGLSQDLGRLLHWHEE